ncbi:MAG: acyltransferase [Candidatus Marinimicrobia bacterium]|nr:acyltransferase [Candidatus Neomarinimicrobiota bacterium]
MKIAIYQFAPFWGNKAGNLKKIESRIDHYPDIDLWILPELCTTGYIFDSRQILKPLAEPFPGGETCSRIEAVTKRNNTSLILGVAEEYNGKIYNSAAVFNNGKHIGTYRKIHLFDREKLLFDPGGEPPAVFLIKGTRVGVMICFDWIFPETVRTLALNGAQLIAHPANLVLPYCPDAMITRSIENRVFTATANRTGKERLSCGEELTFIGGSQVTGIDGKRLGQLSRHEENVLVVEINPAEADNKAINQNNDLFVDRKPELYRLN